MNPFSAAVVLGALFATATAAGELPPEVERLKERYEERVEEIDQSLRSGLKTLHEGYRAKKDFDAMAAVEMAIEDLEEDVPEAVPLCAIVVSTRDKVFVGKLKVGAKRMHGHYEPAFGHVAEELRNAEYTQAGDKLGQTYVIECTTPGYLYVYGLDEMESKDPVAEATPAPGVLGGPYIERNRLGRVLLAAGMTYVIQGYECNLVAARIVMK